MSMELIDKEKAKAEMRKAFLSSADRVVINSILNKLPTVKAIPIEVVEQIKNRLEKMPFYFGTTFHGQTIKTVDVEKVIEMLNEALKEQNG